MEIRLGFSRCGLREFSDSVRQWLAMITSSTVGNNSYLIFEIKTWGEYPEFGFVPMEGSCVYNPQS